MAYKNFDPYSSVPSLLLCTILLQIILLHYEPISLFYSYYLQQLSFKQHRKRNKLQKLNVYSLLYLPMCLTLPVLFISSCGLEFWLTALYFSQKDSMSSCSAGLLVTNYLLFLLLSGDILISILFLINSLGR